MKQVASRIASPVIKEPIPPRHRPKDQHAGQRDGQPSAETERTTTEIAPHLHADQAQRNVRKSRQHTADPQHRPARICSGSGERAAEQDCGDDHRIGEETPQNDDRRLDQVAGGAAAARHQIVRIVAKVRDGSAIGHVRTEREGLVASAHRGAEASAGITAARHSREIVDRQQAPPPLQRLQRAEAHGGRPYAPAGERQASGVAGHRAWPRLVAIGLPRARFGIGRQPAAFPANLGRSPEQSLGVGRRRPTFPAGAAFACSLVKLGTNSRLQRRVVHARPVARDVAWPATLFVGHIPTPLIDCRKFERQNFFKIIKTNVTARQYAACYSHQSFRNRRDRTEKPLGALPSIA